MTSILPIKYVLLYYRCVSTLERVGSQLTKMKLTNPKCSQNTSLHTTDSSSDLISNGIIYRLLEFDKYRNA